VSHALRAEITESTRTREGVLHSTSTKRMLKLGAHKPISITRVLQNRKMDFEHRHIEQDWDEDQAECTGNKVSHPHFGADIQVPKEDPQLFDGRASDCSDGEQPDPFAADNRAECEAGKDKPYPPNVGERLAFVLIAERDPEEGAQTSEEHEGRVEEDETRLGDQAVFKGDEDSTHDGSACAAFEGT
jgi:hypothetical protein